MDFSFGRSCKYGKVRCCRKYMEKQPLYEVKEEIFDFEPSTTTTTTTPATTTTTTTTTTTRFQVTTTSTTTTTSPPTTTTFRSSNLANHRLPDDFTETVGYSSASFHRYSLPSVFAKRLPSFYEQLNSIQVKPFTPGNSK
jgi:hypothetical protein